MIQHDFGYSPAMYGWMSLLIATAYYLAAYFNRSLVHRFHLRKIFLCGAILIGVSGVIILFTQKFVPLIPMAVATYGQALIFSNTIASALQKYPHIPAKASAMFSAMQMLLVSGISAILAFLTDTTLILGLTLICLCTFILLCLQRAAPAR